MRSRVINWLLFMAVVAVGYAVFSFVLQR